MKKIFLKLTISVMAISFVGCGAMAEAFETALENAIEQGEPPPPQEGDEGREDDGEFSDDDAPADEPDEFGNECEGLLEEFDESGDEALLEEFFACLEAQEPGGNDEEGSVGEDCLSTCDFLLEIFEETGDETLLEEYDRCIEDVGNEGAEDEGYNVIIEEAIEACQELVLVAQESGDEEAALAAEQCINEHLAGEEGPWNEEPWDEGRGDEVPGEYPSDEEQQQLEDAFAACEALIITAERSGADEDIQAAEACLTEQLGDEFNQHEPPAPHPCDALIELYEQTQDEALIAEIESCFSQDEVASDDEGGSQ